MLRTPLTQTQNSVEKSISFPGSSPATFQPWRMRFLCRTEVIKHLQLSLRNILILSRGWKGFRPAVAHPSRGEQRWSVHKTFLFSHQACHGCNQTHYAFVHFLFFIFFFFLHAVRLISFPLKMESMIIHKIIFRVVAPHQFGAHGGCRVHKTRRCATPKKKTFSAIVRISSSTFCYRWSRLGNKKKVCIVKRTFLTWCWSAKAGGPSSIRGAHSMQDQLAPRPLPSEINAKGKVI